MTPGYVPGCSTSLVGLLREAADVHLVDDRFGERPLRWRSPFQSNVSSTTTHFGGRMMPSSAGRNRPARARAYGIDQPGLRIEALALLGVERAVGLKVIELAGLEARDEHAPDIAPAVGVAD